MTMLAQVDTHQQKDWAFGLYYEALLGLLDARIERQPGSDTEYAKIEFGVIGVKRWDDLGCSRRIVTGKQSTRNRVKDYRFDKSVCSPNDRSFQGKMLSDFTSVAMFTTAKVRIDYEDGFVNVTKQQVKKAARPLLNLLLDFCYQSTCVGASDEILGKHPGQRLQYRINEMSFALMGLCNWGPNLLIKYESATCYSDWKFRFNDTGFIRICKCDIDCEVQKVSIAMYAIALDIVKILRNEFNSKITMESIFSRENVLDFIARFTTRVALDKFFVKCHVPRTYTFDNTKSNFTLEFFKDHILSKEEALEPKKFNPVKSDRADPFNSSSIPDSNQ